MNKTGKITLYTLLGIFVIALAFTGGFAAGYASPHEGALPSALSAVLRIAPTTQGAPSTDVATLFKPFWQAWDLVHAQFVSQPVDNTKLMQGALSGMMQSLGDPYTAYMSPEEYQQATAPLNGAYEGIGAWVDTRGQYVTITGTMPGSPAEKAGLKPGDQITAIDGQDMSSTPPDVAVTHILGPAGTSVHLTILRQGSTNPLEVDVTRAKINVPSVVSKMLTQDGQRVAYVQLTTFGESTASDLTSALKNLLPQKPAGIVLDLRNNGGGYLTSAVDVVSQFVDQGTVLIEQSGDGSRQIYKVNPGGLATQTPLVVLVNGGTASAAEITAGAIQDHDRGQLVGTTTYGKGSVQNWIPLVDNAGAVRITVAHWLTPNGHLIQGKGLTPDVVVSVSDQDTASGKDPQLDKAVQVLLQKVPAAATPTP